MIYIYICTADLVHAWSLSLRGAANTGLYVLMLSSKLAEFIRRRFEDPTLKGQAFDPYNPPAARTPHPACDR